MKRGDFQFCSKANLETGLKGGSVEMLQKKIGPKVQRILKFSNFVLFWQKTTKSSKFAPFQIFSHSLY
jgi:hypothetical protein